MAMQGFLFYFIFLFFIRGNNFNFPDWEMIGGPPAVVAQINSIPLSRPRDGTFIWVFDAGRHRVGHALQNPAETMICCHPMPDWKSYTQPSSPQRQHCYLFWQKRNDNYCHRKFMLG